MPLKPVCLLEAIFPRGVLIILIFLCPRTSAAIPASMLKRAAAVCGSEIMGRAGSEVVGTDEVALEKLISHVGREWPEIRRHATDFERVASGYLAYQRQRSVSRPAALRELEVLLEFGYFGGVTPTAIHRLARVSLEQTAILREAAAKSSTGSLSVDDLRIETSRPDLMKILDSNRQSGRRIYLADAYTMGRLQANAAAEVFWSTADASQRTSIQSYWQFMQKAPGYFGEWMVRYLPRRIETEGEPALEPGIYVLHELELPVPTDLIFREMIRADQDEHWDIELFADYYWQAIRPDLLRHPNRMFQQVDISQLLVKAAYFSFTSADPAYRHGVLVRAVERGFTKADLILFMDLFHFMSLADCNLKAGQIGEERGIPVPRLTARGWSWFFTSHYVGPNAPIGGVGFLAAGVDELQNLARRLSDHPRPRP
jgi:hypothetical protein